MTLSLQQKKILVTREQKQAFIFSEKIRHHDGVSVEVPLLDIMCKKTSHKVDVSEYDWVFFTSANGVECFLKTNRFAGMKPSFAVVGHKTEHALKKFGCRAHFVPSIYNADVMAKEFMEKHPKAKKLLLVRGNRSRDVLPKQFTRHGMLFDTIEVYETNYNQSSKTQLQQLFQTNHSIDFITFTSPSTIDACMEFIDDTNTMENVLSTVCVCIGTTTEKRAKEAGFQNVLVPDVFTIEGMIDQMSRYLMKEGRYS
ncbi:uroporphyrinogen-III synthase [Virgibacillus sp. W0181]|uniref:uroporphyrinogen-III synthase n=1 Tax=Virgibacillus sp. W0181 TaxID=3391581 RepID=UPI003F45E6FB